MASSNNAQDFQKDSGWEEIAFPDLSDAHTYALEIAGRLLCCRFTATATASWFHPPPQHQERGDRVVVKALAGEVMAKQEGRLTVQRIELKSFNAAYEDRAFAHERYQPPCFGSSGRVVRILLVPSAFYGHLPFQALRAKREEGPDQDALP